MVPDYLIIEEKLRREREEREHSYQVPLQAPTPPESIWYEERQPEKPPTPERGAYIIDLNDYSVTRI